jgi:hypothetical protein
MKREEAVPRQNNQNSKDHDVKNQLLTTSTRLAMYPALGPYAFFCVEPVLLADDGGALSLCCCENDLV